MGILHNDLRTFIIRSQWILLSMRHVSDNICTENPNTHFMFNKFFPPKLCCLSHVEKYGTARQDTDDNIMWHGKDASVHANTFHI
jgi:hypothetical protein